MTRRAAAILLLVGAIALALLLARPALAAVREVTVGNFYYDDATPGDGTVEATQGDQLRFTILDGGPGTPHTVDIDEFGIHSGSLAAGETYTTPPLDRPGTYTLYCKPHQNRGHKATLIIRAATTSTTATTAPATTSPPTTSAPTATTAPSGGGTNTTSAPPAGSPSIGGTSGATSAPTTVASAESIPEAAPSETAAGTTDTTLAPVGRGEADEAALANAPVNPDSLQAAIGRPPARKGTWTRSVRLGLLVLLAMTAAAGAALLRGRRLPQGS